jgi:hypothetical protein
LVWLGVFVGRDFAYYPALLAAARAQEGVAAGARYLVAAP